MSEVELFTFAAVLIGAFIFTAAYAGYCCIRFQRYERRGRVLIPVGALMAWLVITVVALVAIYVLLMAHSQRDTVLTMLRTIGIGYPILGVVLVFALSSVNKRFRRSG